MKDKFSYARGPKRADLHPTPRPPRALRKTRLGLSTSISDERFTHAQGPKAGGQQAQTHRRRIWIGTSDHTSTKMASEHPLIA